MTDWRRILPVDRSLCNRRLCLVRYWMTSHHGVTSQWALTFCENFQVTLRGKWRRHLAPCYTKWYYWVIRGWHNPTPFTAVTDACLPHALCYSDIVSSATEQRSDSKRDSTRLTADRQTPSLQAGCYAISDRLTVQNLIEIPTHIHAYSSNCLQGYHASVPQKKTRHFYRTDRKNRTLAKKVVRKEDT